MKKMRLTESDLNRIVRESVYSVLNENEEDEGMWNQLKQGAKSFFGNGMRNKGDYRNTVADRQERGEWTANKLNGQTPMNFKKRWNAAKTGYKQQGNIDNADKILETLNSLESMVGVSLGKLGQDINKMTIGQLKSYLGRAKGTARGRVSNANNAIYKGMESGVMGSGKFGRI